MTIQVTLRDEDMKAIRELPGVQPWNADAFIIRALVYAAIYEGWFDLETFEKAMERAHIRRGPKKHA